MASDPISSLPMAKPSLLHKIAYGDPLEVLVGYEDVLVTLCGARMHRTFGEGPGGAHLVIGERAKKHPPCERCEAMYLLTWMQAGLSVPTELLDDWMLTE